MFAGAHHVRRRPERLNCFSPSPVSARLFDRSKSIKVALRFSGVNFVSLNFIDYVSMALCMGDNRVGDTSDLLDLPQEMGLARRGSF